MSIVNWLSFEFIRPTDFKYPDEISEKTLIAFDKFVKLLRPDNVVVLSDYRPGDPKEHGKGHAIDFIVPGADSLKVLDLIRSSKLFSGFGMYTNESNYQSFHVDTRPTRSVTDPATWGGVIEPRIDPDTGQESRVTSYVGLNQVVDLVKKNVGSGFVIVALISLLTWKILKG